MGGKLAGGLAGNNQSLLFCKSPVNLLYLLVRSLSELVRKQQDVGVESHQCIFFDVVQLLKLGSKDGPRIKFSSNGVSVAMWSPDVAGCR
jgi:hypothetical protein